MPMEPIALHDGTILNVHGKDQCIGEHCCIHNPSDHPLRFAPLTWIDDLSTMMRVCEHNFVHPDPDDIDVKQVLGMARGGYAGLLEASVLIEAIYSTHMMKGNCDGCCQLTRPHIRATETVAEDRSDEGRTLSLDAGEWVIPPSER